jgi:hypothetical protein
MGENLDRALEGSSPLIQEYIHRLTSYWEKDERREPNWLNLIHLAQNQAIADGRLEGVIEVVLDQYQDKLSNNLIKQVSIYHAKWKEEGEEFQYTESENFDVRISCKLERGGYIEVYTGCLCGGLLTTIDLKVIQLNLKIAEDLSSFPYQFLTAWENPKAFLGQYQSMLKTISPTLTFKILKQTDEKL